MLQINLKRAYDPVDRKNDGYRVLVDRLWPRGIKRADLALDEWCRDIAPSNELRKWFNHEASKVAEFRQRYVVELKKTDEAASLLARIKASGADKVSLLYSAKTAELSQAIVLKKYLETLI